MNGTFRDPTSIVDKREVELLSLAFVFLFASALAVALAPSVRSGEWEFSGKVFQHFFILPVWILGNVLLVKSVREKLPNRDPFILPICSLLAGWGMIAIWRLDPTFGIRQTGWFLLASIILVVLFRAPSNLRWLRHHRYLWLGGGLFLLALTLIFGTNPLGGEPRLWLGCCGLYFQPSEPLRLLLIAFLASYFADHLVFRNEHTPSSIIRTVVPLLVVWSFSILLLFVQRDLGTGSLFVILLAVLLYLASKNWLVLLVAAGMTIIAATFAYLNLYIVQIRVDAWLNPWLDPLGGSYQIVQSLIAFASGGILGTGVGLGEPGLVPAAHTDFIFTVIGEEWGLVGTIGMLTLFASLVTRGIKIAARNQNHFERLLAAGISIAFGLQSILIIGGVTRLLPLTGITLPFVSYGGSSLVTSFVAFGLLMLISNKTSPQAAPSNALRIIQQGLNIAWLSIGLVLIWWGVIRAPALTTRTDNLRRVISERYYQRGAIYDSEGRILAQSMGITGEIQRNYPYAEDASVIGYQSTLYGKSGIESSMDSVLHGETGQEPLNLAWSILLYGHPAAGFDVRLTLDAELQLFGTSLFGNEKGALVLLDAETGDILSLITSPGYDPNSLNEDWNALIVDDNAPLLNRTTQARYQPGMAIVPFLLAWGMENGQFTLDDIVQNPFSSVHLNDFELECSYIPQPEIAKTLRNALTHRCPNVFTEMAEERGYSWLLDAYEAFGFTKEALLRLDSAGALELEMSPSPAQIEFAGIGQSDLVVTPIQMTRAFAALVSDGTLPAVRIIDSVRNPDDRWVSVEPLASTKTAISPNVARNLMRSSQMYSDGVRGFSFNAMTGPEGQTSAWFLGTDGEGQVLTILLETGALSEAERMGQAIFQFIQTNQSP